MYIDILLEVVFTIGDILTYYFSNDDPIYLYVITTAVIPLEGVLILVAHYVHIFLIFLYHTFFNLFYRESKLFPGIQLMKVVVLFF